MIFMRSYNIGPKLGDFLNGLIVPSYIYDSTGEKADVYLSEHGCRFSTGINKTYEELVPILAEQKYINSFQIWNNERVDYEVFRFRQTSGIFRDSWTSIYSELANIKIPDNYIWLRCKNPISSEVGINRTNRELSEHTKKYYKQLLENKEVEFICFDILQHSAFPFPTKLVSCKNLYEMYSRIDGCKLFICNQSAPLSIASALNVERIAELRRNEDAPHYREERSDKMKTFVGD